MIYWQNRILTNVKIALGDKCKSVVSVSSKKPSVFPTCAVRTVINNSYADDLDIGDGENAVICGMSIDIITKTTLADAFSLMSIANTAMYRMGFKRNEGPVEVNDATTPEIFKVTARYSRIIGADDVIKKFDS